MLSIFPTVKSQTNPEDSEISSPGIISSTVIFASTPSVIFDYDANKVTLTSNKTDYKLKEILSGELGLIINNSAQ